MTTRRVNIRTLVNSTKIKRETRNGREVIVVPSATLPDNVVMNGIRYPAEEIEASFAGLDRKPAPLGHPEVNGKFVSALSPEGINANWIGGHNENVRRENGRVFLDKVIDVEVANRTENGRKLIEAINAQKPIHTSTALLCNLEAVTGQEYKFNARGMEFDHDAILLNEPGAATPDQGVGIFVNSSGQEIEVTNSVYESTDRDLDWAMENIVQALERRERAPLIERMKAAILDAFGAGKAETSNQKNEEEMLKEELDKLAGKVDALTESCKGLGETIATSVSSAVANALKPMVDAANAAAASQKAQEEALKADLVAKVVANKILTEETAKTMGLEALQELVKNSSNVKPFAAPVVGNRTAPEAGKGFVAPKVEKA